MKLRNLTSAVLLSLPLLALEPFTAKAADAQQIYKDSVDGIVLVQNDITPAPKQKNTRPVHGLGTGFFVDENLIVTNAHVIAKDNAEGTQEITVVGYETNPRKWKVKVLANDEEADLALLQIVDWDDYKATTKWKILKFAPYKSVEMGSQTVAIGHPGGFEWSVSKGIVSGKDRYIDDSVRFYIQTDAYVYQGNSGGPLLNADGAVIGIDEVMMVNPGGSYGMAMPSDLVAKMMVDLKAGGHVKWASIGIVIKQRADGQGLDVESVNKDSPAEKAGIVAGDKIEFVTTRATEGPLYVREPRDFVRALTTLTVGEKVIVNGESKDGKKWIKAITTVERIVEKKAKEPEPKDTKEDKEEPRSINPFDFLFGDPNN
jgi:S1-C subfamily serine protease